jgi:DNA ligase-1
MRSDAIFNLIEQIAKAKGKQKEVILGAAIAADSTGHLKSVLRWALDPMITFGVIPDEEMMAFGGEGSQQFSQLEEELFERLASRGLSGNAARQAIENRAMVLTAPSRNLLMRILAKDLRFGLGAKKVNKVSPGLLFEFNVMLAEPYEPERLKFPVRIEPKFDGWRLIARNDSEGGWDYLTRTGKPIDSVPDQVSQELSQLRLLICHELSIAPCALVFDGELMGDSFKETSQQARRKNSTFEAGKYYVFDWMKAETFENLKKQFRQASTYEIRRKFLQAAFKALEPAPKHLVLPTSYLANSTEEIEQYYANARNRGLEGLIIKNIHGYYHPRRHYDWMKLKGEETIDLPIADAEEGKGKYVGMLGAFIVDNKGVKCRVGGGFTDEQRKDYWERWLKEPQALIGAMIEAEFQEETEDGALRHGRFVRERHDKEEEF